MPQPRVVVLDHGSGNLRSAERALLAAGADTLVTGDPAIAQEADGLVVPGVGAFAACMAGLTSVRGHEVIDRRLAGGRPVLGICVGMQLMFEEGHEHGVHTEGLSEWPGTVERLSAPVLPHMGWNTVDTAASSRLFRGLDGGTRFYFVHSYAAQQWQGNPDALLTWATHYVSFLAAVEDGPLSATQFHPEKSGDAGATLLANWLTAL